MDDFSDEDIHHFVGQASVNAYLLEDMCKITSKEVERLESQLSIHEVNLQVLEPIKYKPIAEEANAWIAYVFSMAGPT